MLRIEAVNPYIEVNGEVFRFTYADSEKYDPNAYMDWGDPDFVKPGSEMWMEILTENIMEKLSDLKIPPDKAKAFAKFAAAYFPWMHKDIVIYDWDGTFGQEEQD